MTAENASPMSTLVKPLIDQFVEMGENSWAFFPKLVQGTITLAVLLIFAVILRFIIRNICQKLKLDSVAGKVGLTDNFAKLGITSPLSKVLSQVVFWMVSLWAVKAAAGIWGVVDISQFVHSIIVFLPRLFIAAFILFAGLLIADLVRKAVQRGLDQIGVDYGAMIGNVIYGLLAVMIATVALGELGIETDLLNATVKIVVGAVALAVALALGLGLRGVARNIVSGVYARDLFPPGSVLEVDGSPAVVEEVGAVATRLVSDDNRYYVIPNSTLISRTSRGISRVSQEFVRKR